MSDGLVVGALFGIAVAVLGAIAPEPVEVITKAVRYDGRTTDEVMRRYEADASLFTRTGWVIERVAWDTGASRPTLVVAYRRQPAGRWRPAAKIWSRLAAMATAMAVPAISAFLLMDSGLSGGAGAIVLAVAVVLGVVIGLRSEGLGRGPDRWLDVTVVIVGVVLGLFVASVVAFFFALFGSLIGFHAVVVVLGGWLVIRAVVALARRVAASKSGPQ